MNTNPTMQTQIINEPDTLLIGIGNNGRNDDGLGWAFIDDIRMDQRFKGQMEYRYQLQVEDAELISHARQVIFVDAYEGNLENGFKWQKCKPSNEFSFTTHEVPPDSILYLCEEIYKKSPNVYLLMIEGESWELKIGMTDTAKKNLKKALSFFKRAI
jgi:hydrogenase maturation protease